jgi:hypothetical protein
MNAVIAFVRMTVLLRARRIGGLLAFGLLFVAAAITARTLTGSGSDHVDMDPLYELGGTTLVSGLLLLTWLLGRLPIIASLVLMQGVFSEDRALGYARLYLVRPRSTLLLYFARFVVLSGLAFAISALFIPLFDLIMLGEFSGMSVFAFIGAQVIVFSAVTALASTITRADAWVALFLGIVAMIWDALRRMEFFQAAAPLVREGVSVVLPPQGAMMRIEAAFATATDVPIDAMLYIVIYATLALLIAGVRMVRREI